MNKYLLFFSLITVLAIGFVFSYFYFEKPLIEKSFEHANLTLSVFADKKQIEANYVIYVNGFENSKDKTVKNGYVLESLPINSTIQIFTEEEGYYPSIEIFRTSELENIRKEIYLEKYGTLNFSTENKITDDFFYFNLTKNGIFKNPLMCFRWSNSIITLKVINLTATYENPERYFVDRCHKLEEFNETQEFGFQILKLKELTSEDFIKIYLIDQDFLEEDLTRVSHSKEINNTNIDVFQEDIEILINK